MIDLKEKIECNKYIMDSINNPDILFEEKGICNHSLQFDIAFNKLPRGQESLLALDDIIDKIKKIINKYDIKKVIVSCAPFSSAYQSLEFKKAFSKINLIVDF